MIRNFDQDLAKFAREAGLELEQVVRKVVMDGHKRVSMKTPVDTGRAKASWNVGAGEIDYKVAPKKGKSTGRYKGRSSPPNTGYTMPTLQKGDGNKVIYITNNLPYIGDLENGSSTQAANGMVAVSLHEMVSGISNVIRK